MYKTARYEHGGALGRRSLGPPRETIGVLGSVVTGTMLNSFPNKG